MPTYQYACTRCDHAFEQVQSFSDDALTVCPRCEGRLRKIFNAVGVVFKGSGFYRNDSRATTPAAAESGSSGTEKVGAGTAAGSSSDGSGSTGSSAAPSKAPAGSASKGGPPRTSGTSPTGGSPSAA